LILVWISAGNEKTLSTERWWLSIDMASTVGITAQQSDALDGLYETSLSARARTTEHVVELTEELVQLARDGDEQRLPAVMKELAKARFEERDLQRRLVNGTIQLLTPLQRELLNRSRLSTRFMRIVWVPSEVR
jgi:hypothetical protein